MKERRLKWLDELQELYRKTLPSLVLYGMSLGKERTSLKKVEKDIKERR